MEEGYGASSDELEEIDLEESDLEEILAEIEALSEDEIVDEAKEDETEEIEVSDDKEVDASGEEDTQEITVTLGKLKDVIQALQGLAPELETDEMSDDEAIKDDDIEDEETEEKEEMEEPISLDEILSELEEDESNEKHPMEEKKHHKGEEKESDEKKKMKKELEEAKDTIQALQESMNEINLVNAKLLYMNKIFKAKSLTESQKIKVVKAFDRAASVKEVKNTYEVLKESVSAKKTQIQESFGYASKPAGVSPNANVIDADPFVNRWQKLAGL